MRSCTSSMLSWLGSTTCGAYPSCLPVVPAGQQDATPIELVATDDQRESTARLARRAVPLDFASGGVAGSPPSRVAALVHLAEALRVVAEEVASLAKRWTALARRATALAHRCVPLLQTILSDPDRGTPPAETQADPLESAMPLARA